MKKRIISAILVIVMSVMALASCAPAFNFAEEDLSAYVDFNYDKFIEALQKIEIEDADFTSNEATRQEKVTYNILASLTSAAITNNDKLVTGSLTENDVLLEAAEFVDTTHRGGFRKNARRILEGRGGDERIRLERGLGNTEKLGSALCESNVLACFHTGELGLTVFEGSEVVIGRVNGSAELNAKHLVIRIRPEKGNNDTADNYQSDNDKADQSDFVFHKSLYAVTEKGSGGTHLHHIRLVICGCGEKRVNVKLHIEIFVCHYNASPIYSRVMRGSMTL